MEDSEAGPPPVLSNWRAARSTERLQRDFSDPDFDDSDWTPIEVPSHWQLHPDFADYDGTLLYRADLRTPALQPGQRRYLRFEGLCYSGDVFLDGVYLGETEGYFTSHRFEITDLDAGGGSSVLAVEVGAPRDSGDGPKRAITGWFADPPGAPTSWNPAGIWRPVDVLDTGPVSIRHFRAICTDATADAATITLRAVLYVEEPCEVELHTEVAGVVDSSRHEVAAGENRIEWQVEVPSPELWWPMGMGPQPLFDLRVQARTEDGTISDRKHRRIGFRTTTMRHFVLRVNKQRVFLRGVNIGPLDLDLARMSPEAIRNEVEAIVASGFNAIRVRSHVTRREFHDVCDELGVLVWQDLPMVGSYARSITNQAEQQTREMIDLLGHHPSLVVWGGHMRPHTNEPRTTAAPNVRQQQIPSWNRTVLDRAIRRTFSSDDPSRKVVAHSDVAPHVPQLSGSDLGLYFGWFDGEAGDLAEYAATLPRFVRFVSDLGAQALPSAPTVDLDAMLAVTGAEAETLHARVPATDHHDVHGWIERMQRLQADVLRTSIEVLRVLKYKPVGGYFAGLWRSAAPGLTRALIDADGMPREARDAARLANSPVLPVIYPPTATIPSRTSSPLAIHLVNDLHDTVELTVTATVVDGRGTHVRRFTGIAEADSVAWLADVSVRGGRIGDDATIELVVEGVDLHVTNRYRVTAT